MTARYSSTVCGVAVGSPYHRNSCSRSSEAAPRPPPDVSERSADLASSATAGSSRARVLSASASVIMRSVCPTRSSGGRCVADLTGDVRVPSSLLCGVARLHVKVVRTTARFRPYGIISWVSGIYDEPELYELACAYRDIPAEVTALQAWCATHHTGPVSLVIELA